LKPVDRANRQREQCVLYPATNDILYIHFDFYADLEKLHLWAPLQTLLTSAPTPSIKMHVLWVIGTALQNNPAAQDAVRLSSPHPSLPLQIPNSNIMT
jgi:hypothetical protein